MSSMSAHSMQKAEIWTAVEAKSPEAQPHSSLPLAKVTAQRGRENFKRVGATTQLDLIDNVDLAVRLEVWESQAPSLNRGGDKTCWRDAPPKQRLLNVKLAPLPLVIRAPGFKPVAILAGK